VSAAKVRHRATLPNEVIDDQVVGASDDIAGEQSLSGKAAKAIRPV
jgi:hypothetical protein